MNTPATSAALPESVDLAVIGGGPSGSTMAMLVARAGYRVLVLEKDRHPRFHIGESLLPHNMPIFRRLGLLDRVKALGVAKPGVDFTPASEPELVSEIRFSQALEVPADCDQACQVLRSDFDALLFAAAGEAGAMLAAGCRVRSVEFDAADTALLELDRADGSHSLRARFVVDASGRDCFLGRRFDLQARNRQHGTAALYAHFSDVPRRPGDAAGNISIYWFDQGWIWMIPLPDGVMSVGAVCNPAYLRGRGRDVTRFFHATLARNPFAARRMADARLVSPVTATGNYAYCNRRLDGPRWLMIGDAGLFIDPVFSSGVYFGMHGAEVGARVVLAELAGDAPAARRERRRYRARVRRGVRELSWFIYRFPTPAMRKLLLSDQQVLGLKQAVISLLAGDLYDNPRVRWRLRLFRLVYWLTCLPELAANLKVRRQGRRNASVVFDHGH